MEEDDVITLLIPGYQIIFGPRRDKLFCLVFFFHKGLSNVICDPVLDMQSEGLNIS